jgi:hypothetical protein
MTRHGINIVSAGFQARARLVGAKPLIARLQRGKVASSGSVQNGGRPVAVSRCASAILTSPITPARPGVTRRVLY